MMERISDCELVERLKAFGVSAGPITDTTRDIYTRKLSKLFADSTETAPPETSHRGVTPPFPVTPPGLISTTPPSLPAAVTAPPPGPDSSQAVVEQLLLSLDNPKHVANDTAFIFPRGEVILASRAILATQCTPLIPVLFNTEVPYSVKVVTLSGHRCECLIRANELVLDLKEKISLSQGLTIPELRLVFMEQDLPNGSTIQSCGVQEGATIHLVLIASENRGGDTVSFSCPSMSPSLSIYHLQVGLGHFSDAFSLQQHHPPHSSPAGSHVVPLPSHLAHVVHVYDVQYLAFKIWLTLLYSGKLQQDDGGGSVSLSQYVACHVLGQLFHLSLPRIESCASAIRASLTMESADSLLAYSQTTYNDPLKNICLQFISNMNS